MPGAVGALDSLSNLRSNLLRSVLTKERLVVSAILPAIYLLLYLSFALIDAHWWVEESLSPLLRSVNQVLTNCMDALLLLGFAVAIVGPMLAPFMALFEGGRSCAKTVILCASLWWLLWLASIQLYPNAWSWYLD